jgi:ABC-2 type transport system ATP-binding protein
MSGGWIIFDYKLSIVDNLRFWAAIEGVPLSETVARVDEVLRAVDLEKRKNDFPENLSAGFRQRLNLARCLLSERPIYLLDEPTANVDPYSAQFMREQITKLKHDKKTIVLATHNLWEAELLCDRIAIFDKGKVIALDTTDAIKKGIGDDVFIVTVTQCPPLLIKEVSALNYIKKVVQNDSVIALYGDVKPHLPEIIDICRKYTSVVKCDVKESSLNDVFLQLIAKQEKTRGGS